MPEDPRSQKLEDLDARARQILEFWKAQKSTGNTVHSGKLIDTEIGLWEHILGLDVESQGQPPQS